MGTLLARRTPLAVTVIAIAWGLVGGPSAGAATGSDDPVSVVAPVPGAVVPAGDVALRARVGSTVTAARFRVGDGRVVPADVGADDAGPGADVTGRVRLPPGDHLLTVEVEDEGQVRARSWEVTATDRTVHRHAGANRIGTAVAVSTAAFPDAASAPAAVLARSDDFADALAGVPLAAAEGGPLLLSRPDALPDETARELQRLLSARATVHLLGGEGALGAGVASSVEALGFRVLRHAGSDRFATAAAVARALPTSQGAVVASGRSFPDALAASVPAARSGWPVLLAAPGGLPESSADALRRRGVTNAVVVGGPGALGAEVEHRVRDVVPAVRRIAGPDRYATAVAVADAFAAPSAGVALASGRDFPDALAGAGHAAATGQPLLLTGASALPRATAEAVRARGPRRLDVYGGPGAVSDAASQAALHAAIDGPHAPRVTATAPASGSTVPLLDTVTVRLDRPVDPSRSSVHVEVGGREVPTTLGGGGPTATLTARARADGLAPLDTATPGRLVVRAVAADGTVARHAATFTYLEPDPHFATAGDVALHLPSRDVEMVGFHESVHPGARQQTPRATATPTTVLASRGRDTGSHTAADVVASPRRPVLAPVTGRVVRAGAYVLYCRYADDFVVIEPDAHPGWEVKLLHMHGLAVEVGDRVVAQESVVAAGPRVLPFASQVDTHSSQTWPHVHVEVVDPSIPPRPGGGC